MTQTDHFAKPMALAWAIAFARWPIFKIVSCVEYLVLFGGVFWTKQLCCSFRMVFGVFYAFLICDPKYKFCKGLSLGMGYSVCKMVDFQNIVFSRIFGVFSSRFLHSTTVLLLESCFSHVFGTFNF